MSLSILFFYKNGNSWVLGETSKSFMPTGKYFLKEYSATQVDIFPVDQHTRAGYWGQRDVTTIKKNSAGDFYASLSEFLTATADFFGNASSGGGGGSQMLVHCL